MKKTFKSIILISLLAFTMASCNKNEVTKIVLNVQDKTMYVGEEFRLTATIEASDDPSEFGVSWSSTNTEVATVDNAGLVTAIAKGEAQIIAKAGKKETACAITVDEKADTKDDFVYGELYYYGDYYEVGISNNFEIYLFDEALLTDGIGRLLYIELNASLSAIDELPDGTYTAMTGFNDSDFKPFTFSPAYTYENDVYGSCVARVENNSIVESTYIIGGEFTVSKSNNVYTIAYSFETLNENNENAIFAGSFTGELDYYDETDSSGAPALRSQKQFSKIKIAKKKF